MCNAIQRLLIAKAEQAYKLKLKTLREDVERTGGVYGGSELALMEDNGTLHIERLIDRLID